MASDDLTRQQHDIVPDENNEKRDPLDEMNQDEEQIAGGEINQDIDKLRKEAYGDDDNDTIGDEINKDEVTIAKDLNSPSEESSDEENI